MEEENKHLELVVVDYIILVFVMAVTAAIGFYHIMADRGKETTESLLLGNRRMHFIPIALSIMASHVGSVIGTPYYTLTEGFTNYCLRSIGYSCCLAITAFVHLPVYYRLKLTTPYQYFEIRFRKKIFKVIAACVFIFQTASSVASILSFLGESLNSVLGFHAWGTAISIAIICTLYTALGGFKAVIWTDVFQAGIIVTGMLAILIGGSIKEGGMNKVWKIATEGERGFVFHFTLDPRVDPAVWNWTFAYMFHWLNLSASDQIVMQRGLSASSLRSAQKAFLLAALLYTFDVIVESLIGLILYSRYHDCDPWQTGIISAIFGYSALYTSEVLANGFPGVLLAASFCAVLSSFSSGLNAMAAVTLHDILKEIPIFTINEKRESLWIKLLALILGMFVVIYAVFAANFPTIEYYANQVRSLAGAPVVGAITMSMFFKHVNWKGFLAGWIMGLSFLLWIRIGVFVFQPEIFAPYTVPQLTKACLNVTDSAAVAPMDDNADSRNVLYPLYQIDYAYWESVYSMFLASLTAVLVSYFTGGEDQKKLNPKSVINCREAFCPCRYKINPEEDVPNETDELQQKPGEIASQYTGKLTQDSDASKLTKITGTSKLTKISSRSQKSKSVKNTSENTEHLKQIDDVVDKNNMKPLAEKDSGLTRLYSNEAIDQTETLHESPKLEETDVAEKSSGGAITA